MGLNAFDKKTKLFKHYSSANGLPSDAILSVLEDEEKNLWLATENGLCKFNPEQNTFFTYDVTDGLPGNEFTRAALKGKDDKFYLGTRNGLVVFSPTELKNNTHKPSVAITKFSVLNKPWALPKEINFTEELTLSYREYFFSFEFAAFDFSAPQKNQYAYKLEGFNEDWVYNGNKREATFTNLNAGEYILKVKASNNRGVWSDEAVLLKVIITPPWWKTKTFYASCIIALLFLIYGYIKWRERKLLVERKILKQNIEDATTEIREQKELIEEKNKEVLDSIHYAKRIQKALMTNEKSIEKTLNRLTGKK
jgi:ligand-binding sensor domain-containing protein